MFATVKKLIGKAYLGATGWKIEGTADHQKCVLIAAPHTSNWDLSPMLAAGWVYGVKVSWLGKDSLFKFPYGWVLKALGGIPVDRSKSNDLVKQAADLIKGRERIVLAVPPEGTRSGGGSGWRSGFYYIGQAAEVPIVLGYVDHGRKRAGLGPSFMATGDVKGDMDRIRAFYTQDMARYPDKFREPRLRSEIAREDMERQEALAEVKADDAAASGD